MAGAQAGEAQEQVVAGADFAAQRMQVGCAQGAAGHLEALAFLGAGHLGAVDAAQRFEDAVEVLTLRQEVFL